MQNQSKNTAFLLLGSNLGDRILNLNQALINLGDSDITILQKSSIYETEPWGVTDQQPYLNQAVKIETKLNSKDLLDLILSTEKKLGRERLAKWDSRTIDIDIIYFNDEIVNDQELTIPHPFLEKRRFVLVPLCELDENYIHPVLNLSNLKLLEICPDQLEVKKFVK